jgi:lipopolysaccharide/colanic/teichoic acid biosynthesis glycosyltransferase
MARKLLTHPEYGLELAGFVDADPRKLGADVAHIPVVGTPDDIPRLVYERRIERVIVAFSGQSHVEELDTIRMLKDLDLQVDIVPRLFEVVGPSADISVFEGLSVFALPPMKLSRGSLVAKRALDVLVAGIGLVAVAPLMAAIAVAIKIDTRGPLLYRGNRIGPRGRLFAQLKFRSMDPRYATSEGDAAFRKLLSANPSMAIEFASTQKLTNDPRVTRVGRLLRRTSLDELPQLFNVLRGDLSLVGPRPITQRELRERYKPRMLAPHEGDSLLIGYWDSPGLRPGLTGYWQISGRSTMSFDERIRLDTAYLTSWSLKLDLAILARTTRALLAGRGAY